MGVWTRWRRRLDGIRSVVEADARPTAVVRPWIDWTVFLATAAGAAAWFAWLEVERAGGLGFPLDDGWIHLRFARTLAAGGGFSYNAGIPSSGSTAPVWTLLLALPASLGLNLIGSAKVIGVVLATTTAGLAWRLVLDGTGSRPAAIVTGLALVSSSFLVWGSVSGMEVPLYAALVLGALLASSRRPDRPLLWGALSGLAAAARPETLVLFPLLWLHGLWRVRHTTDVRQVRAAVLGPVAGLLLVLGPLLLWNLYASGQILPATFYAKRLGFGTSPANDLHVAAHASVDRPWLELRMVWRVLASQGVTLAILAALGAAAAFVLPRARAAGAAPVMAGLLVVTPLVKGALVPYPVLFFQNGRYAAHLLVVGFVLAGLVLGWIERGRIARRALPIALAAVLLAGVAARTRDESGRYVRQVANINAMQVRMGQWLADTTAPETVVATNDIGAIGYVSGRFIVDTEGLVTPEAVDARRRKDIWSLLERTRPDLLIVFPEWYPDLAPWADRLVPVQEISAPRYVAGGAMLVAFRTPWTRPGLVAAGEPDLTRPAARIAP